MLSFYSSKSQDLPDKVETILGTLQISPLEDSETKSFSLSLNGNVIESYEDDDLIDVYFDSFVRLKNEDCLIISENWSGYACPITNRLLILKSDGSVMWSDFGGCHGYSEVIREGEKIKITYPVRFKPDEVRYIYSKGKLSEKGKNVKFEKLCKIKDGAIEFFFPKLKDYLGKPPYETIEDPQILKLFKKILGKDFDSFADNIIVTSGTYMINNYYFGSGCKPHFCNTDAAAFCINVYTGLIFIAVQSEDRVFFYNAQNLGELPLPLWKWIDETGVTTTLKR